MSTQVITPELPVTNQTVNQELRPNSILESALMLVINRRWIPMAKAVKSKVLQSTADPRMVSATKKLFDSQELKAIIRHEEKLDEWLKWKGTPMPLKKGHHLIPADLFNEVEQKLVQHVAERATLIDAFIRAYEKAVNDARLLLGDQFNENDYLSVESVRRRFIFRWEYLEWTISDKLREINREVAARKEEEWRTTITEAGQAADQLLTAQFKVLVDHLSDKLRPTGMLNEDGSEKKKKLHDTTLDKINQFLTDVNARNVNNNQQLKTFTDQTRQLLAGVTTAQLKENSGLKIQVATGFASLKDSLDKFIVEQGTRSITFDDEE